MTPDLFAGNDTAACRLKPGLWLLPRYASDAAPAMWAALQEITATSPPRRMLTPGGQQTSVAMTNCGPWGWVSDRRGYRYAALDPEYERPWPALPPAWLALAGAAAGVAGFEGFAPDACLINFYDAGTRMGLHQDRDEEDFTAPIVSVSLGLPATFRFGGATRRGPCLRLPLAHGDVVVFGGPARLDFHGVSPIKPGVHPLTGPLRINLTLRRAKRSSG